MRDRAETVLSVVDALLGVDALLKSIFSVFGGKWALMLAFPGIPSSEISKLLLLTRQESGALVWCGREIACLFYTALRRPSSLVQSCHSSARMGSVSFRFSPDMQCGFIPQFESPWLVYFFMSARPKQVAIVHTNPDFRIANRPGVDVIFLNASALHGSYETPALRAAALKMANVAACRSMEVVCEA